MADTQIVWWKCLSTGCALLLLSLILPICEAQESIGETNTEFSKFENVTFATVNARELTLDLYRPLNIDRPPLLVWVHGGAWRGGSKEWHPLYMVDPKFIVSKGYALASLDFRLSGEAKFPAQIYDIKAGIRFLRQNADLYQYDASRIGILGASSGGHLAALVGVTNGDPRLEGALGDALDASSNVQAIVSYFGASNLESILQQSTPRGLRVRVPALDQFIGGQPENVPEAAQLASPVSHIDGRDPPLLLIHGDQDPQMPINQSHELFGLYSNAGLQVQFEVVYGGAHGGDVFFDKTRNQLVISFLDKHLR